MLEWLLAPIDPTRAHEVGFMLSWHARLMVVAWGMLAPMGVIAARFFKVLPGQDWPREVDNQTWWVTHRVMQYSAFMLALVALMLVWMAGRQVPDVATHRVLGYGVLGLAVLQVLGGLLRGSKGGPTDTDRDGTLRGDHFDMTRRRLVFEGLHKALGYLTLLLAVAAILSGLWSANAPVWMWVALGMWWIGLVGVWAVLQRRGMAVDTYQAIWGPDPSLPGNQMRPIGIGIKRKG